MDNFDSWSFVLGLALGLINGAAVVCFARSWKAASPGPCDGYNINQPAPKNALPAVPPKAPPPPPAQRHHVTVELRHPPRHPDWGPDLRRP